MIRNKVHFNLGVFIVLLVFLVSGVSASECFFKTFNSSCLRFDDSYKSFTLSQPSNVNFDHYKVEIYKKENPSNKLELDVDNSFKVNMLAPYLEPGVYVMKVVAYDKAGNSISKSFEYVFDNLEPLPPIISTELSTKSGILDILGEAEPNSKVFAKVGNNAEISSDVDKTGEFSMRLNNLAAGNNYVRFYTNRNGMISPVVERVIVYGDLFENYNANIESISLDDLESLNDRTVNSVTTKRNFYVQGSVGGTNTLGGVVYVNGVKALVDQNGKFGCFVLLNEGDNSIVAESGNIKSNSYNVKYVDLKFQFLDIGYDKIVTQNSISFGGKVNFDYPFLVFLNGKFMKKVEPNNNGFDFGISGLKAGKNFVELRGVNNQVIDTIIYYDSQEPTSNFITQSKLAKSDKLIFEITDDIGIKVNSVQLKVGDEVLEPGKLKVVNDFYMFDISDFDSGSYNAVLSGTDLAGKSFSQTVNVNINPSNTLIEKMSFDNSNSEVIGDKVFFDKKKLTVTLIPSRNIAFKSIFLDGVEQTDYEIFGDNSVKINLDIKQNSGIMKLNFINNEYADFSQEFSYYTDDLEPTINLDYVKKSCSVDKVFLSGEIVGKNVDWSSIEFNSQNSFTKYGNFFEALVDVNKRNLEVSGESVTGAGFVKTYGSLLYKDDKVSSLYLEQNGEIIKDSLMGSVDNNDENYGVLNFIGSYDGFDFNRAYLSGDSFVLPVQQRIGYRSLNLKGFESSDMKLRSIVHFKVESNRSESFSNDGSSPEVFFNGNDIRTLYAKHFVEGNIKSSASIVSVTVNGKNGCDFDSLSFVCDVDLVLGDNEFNVCAKDSNGKSGCSFINIEKKSPDIVISLDELFGDDVFSAGGKNFLFGTKASVKGSVSRDALIKVLMNGQEILQNEKNGSFTIDLDFGSEIAGVDQKEISLQLKAEDEYGSSGFSRVVKLVYKRVFETFASVFVG